jgi:hypothetical protein
MKKILLLPALLLVSVIVSAQAPNFSGTWKINTGKSKLSDQFSFAPKQMIIVQSGNEINIEKLTSFQDQDMTTKDKYTLDGKECVNAGFMDTQKKSTATWSDDKKSLKVISKISIGDGDMTTTEIYKMDGGNLVLDSSSSSSFGDMAETIFFDKQ